jgi:hypothetical protein
MALRARFESGKHLQAMPWRLEVGGLLHDLEANPKLWNQFAMRTAEKSSPHHRLDDIFVRYNPRAAYDGDRQAFNGPHVAEWWKAADLLPNARRLAFEVMDCVEGEHLGMVLITRIPPMTNCQPHRDGGWHAGFYDKYAVQVKSSPGQRFCFEGEALDARPGEMYLFNNAETHWVENQTSEERITLIVCIRTRYTGVQ